MVNLFLSTLTIAFIIILSISSLNVNAKVVDTGRHFTLDIPNNWAYGMQGYTVSLTPSEFAAYLVNQSVPLYEKMKDGCAYTDFYQDVLYPIKNAPLDVYVKYKIDEQNAMNVTTKQNITVSGEPAVKITADGIESFKGIKFAEYMLMHNQQPYIIIYRATEHDFQKYLPTFEQILNTMKFIS